MCSSDLLRGVPHCFTGTAALADSGLALGFYVSLAGIVTFPKAEALRETVRRVPLDRLLTETDSPFLAPVPHRGKRNESSYLRLIAQRLAEIKNISLEEVDRITTENAKALFG